MNERNKRNLIYYIAVLCIIVGGITRVLYCWFYPIPVRDSFVYKEIIESWISSGIYSPNEAIPPLGMFIFKIPAVLGFETIEGGTIVNIVLGLFIIILIIKISLAIIPSMLIALCSGLILATHPTFVQYSCHMTRDNSFLFFGSIAFYSTIKYVKSNRIVHVIISALFVSAAFLCRHEATELFILFLVAILCYSKKRRIKIRIGHSLIFIVTSILSVYIVSYFIGVQFSFFSLYKDELLKDVKPGTQGQIIRLIEHKQSND